MSEYVQPNLDGNVEDPTIVLQDMIAELVDGIEIRVGEVGITPYQIATALNVIFKSLNSQYSVRPQMMYNYDRNGLIVKGSKNQKRYSRVEVAQFVEKFATRNFLK